MRMTKSNFISMIAVFVCFGLLIFAFFKREKLEKQILTDGYFCMAIIKEKVQNRFSSKTFIYKYIIKQRYYENKDGMNHILSEKYEAGDTIIIKFLPNEPEKSMIIEENEYKACYGVPPMNGWKELPKCK